MAAQLPFADVINEQEEVLEHPFRLKTPSSEVEVERQESINHFHEPLHISDLEKAQPMPELRRTTSGYSIALSVKPVPRSRRAGLFGRFTLLYEAEEPKNYPRRIKWFITFIIAMCAVAAPMGSAIILRKESSRNVRCVSRNNLATVLEEVPSNCVVRCFSKHIISMTQD